MSPQLLTPLSEGFLLGLGLIIGFGPQNSFILQQGIKRKFILTVALLASLIDLCLIALGVGGAGSFFARQPSLAQLVTWAGVIFLLFYGWKSFAAALEPLPLKPLEAGRDLGRSAVIFSILAVSLLNPGAYLDTLLIIGGGSAQYAPSLQTLFALGAALASIVWFFALAFGAARLSGVLANRAVLRAVDALSGVIMWAIASRLLLHML